MQDNILEKISNLNLNENNHIIYKETKNFIEKNNILYEHICNIDLQNKYIWLDLLFCKEIKKFLIEKIPKSKEDLQKHFYLILRYINKYEIGREKNEDEFIIISKSFFKYKFLRKIIIKIFKFYKITDIDFVVKYNLIDYFCFSNSEINFHIFEKINSNDFKYVKKYILNNSKIYLPNHYTKVGYINLRILVSEYKSISNLFTDNNNNFNLLSKDIKNSSLFTNNLNNKTFNIEFNKSESISNFYFKEISGDINLLFFCCKHNKHLYFHQDEEVIIENFKYDNKISLSEFFDLKYEFKEFYNIDILIKVIKNKNFTEQNICEILNKRYFIIHENICVRYLAYSLLGFVNNCHQYLNNLLTDKCKIIRNKFTNLYKFVNLNNYDLNKICVKTLIKYCKLLKLKKSDIEKIFKNLKIDNKFIIYTEFGIHIDLKFDKLKKSTKLWYLFKNEKYKKLLKYLINEKNLKYILILKNYLKIIFLNNIKINYKKLIKYVLKFAKQKNLKIRNGGGLSLALKCILSNKFNRTQNLNLITNYLFNNIKNTKNLDFKDNKIEKIETNINNFFHIIIEIYKKYELIEPELMLNLIFTHLNDSNFVLKNYSIRIFEFIYKKYDVLDFINIKCENDDAFFVMLILYEKYGNVNIPIYKGKNLFIKQKLLELNL